MDIQTVDDIELVNRLQSGDESALTLIFKKYWQSLFSSAYSVLKDQHACEDIIQDIFVNLWKRRDSIEITTSLKAYLNAATRYGVYRQIRTGAARVEIFENIDDRIPGATAYGSLEHKELLQRINTVIDRLSLKCKMVYKLSREEQLSHKEIASKLQISVKTVENHLTKALRELRSSLGLY